MGFLKLNGESVMKPCMLRDSEVIISSSLRAVSSSLP